MEDYVFILGIVERVLVIVERVLEKVEVKVMVVNEEDWDYLKDYIDLMFNLVVMLYYYCCLLIVFILSYFMLFI